MARKAFGFRGRVSVAHLTRVGTLGAIAALLYYWPQISIIPPIYKLDFSTLPALLAGFSMGSPSALAVLFVKDLTGLFHSSSAGVGELADFLVSGAFVVCASALYARRRSLKGALTGMCAGIAAMGIVGALANYYIMIPFYMGTMKMDGSAIVGMVAKTIPAVDSLWKLIVMATVPFNLFKGIVLCAVTLLIYKRLSPILHAKRRDEQ